MPKKSDQLREPTQTVALQVRLKEELRAKLEAAAQAAGRTMNAEIVERLSRTIDYDGLYSDHLRPTLGAIAFDCWRVENRTKMKWTEDRATALAIAELAGDSFRYGTPMANSDAITEALAETKAVGDLIERKSAYLVEVGAITHIATSNAFRHFFEAKMGKAPIPAAWVDAVGLLLAYDYFVVPDLNQPVEDWPLVMDGRPLSKDEKSGAAAVLRSIGDLGERMAKASEMLNKATAEEEAAEIRAKSLLAELGRG